MIRVSCDAQSRDSLGVVDFLEKLANIAGIDIPDTVLLQDVQPVDQPKGWGWFYFGEMYPAIYVVTSMRGWRRGRGTENRPLAAVLRTAAHEFAHYWQECANELWPVLVAESEILCYERKARKRGYSELASQHEAFALWVEERFWRAVQNGKF